MIAYLAPPQLAEFLPGCNLPPVPHTGTRVVLLRHGYSTFNDAECFQGSSDQSELTARGVAASQKVGQFLAHCPIDAVYASPLKRAQDTVASVLPYLKAPKLKRLAASALLREIDLPAWEGLRYETVRSQQPVAYRCWRETPEQFQMTGNHCKLNEDEAQPSAFYPVRDLYQRAQQFWQMTLPHHRGQTLLVVSHGSTNQALINTALGLPPCQHHTIQQTYNGLTVLDFETPHCEQGQLHVLNLTVGDRLPPVQGNKQGLRLLLLPCQANASPDPALTTLLQGETVQAAVVEGWEGSRNYPCHQAAQSLLKHNPETVVLSVQRSQLWHQWQAAIHRSLNAHTHTGLTTVLAVAQPAPLQHFLRTLLTLPSRSNTVALQSNTLSVVHYPSTQEHPILQGMNLSAVV
ncbi:MAG: histidine phosphatase family protein [Leptolyngbya sp. SIO1E4]|nr:histidine phosphatase family protein [Leptolyngbya sp. SIO1E4]